MSSKTLSERGMFFSKENIRWMYFSRSGRTGRKTYILGTLFLAFAYTIAVLPSLILKEFIPMVDTSLVTFVLKTLPVVFAICAFYAWFMLSIKRAHDRGRSERFAWMVLAIIPSFWFIDLVYAWLFGSPALMNPFGYNQGTNPMVLMARAVGPIGAIFVGLSLWFLVESIFVVGEKGRNKYGPDPLA